MELLQGARYMGQLQRGVQILRENGILLFTKKLARSVKDQLLVHRYIAPYFRRILGPKLHQQLLVWGRLGYWPQISEPRTFNEKILNRMIFSKNKIFETIHNKRTAREFVRERVGDEILNTVYYTGDDPDTIPFESLPESYIIKPTVGTGDVIFVNENDAIDVPLIKERCNTWMSEDYFSKTITGHYWYQDANPGIIIEKRLTDEEYNLPLDYKFYVFHGQVEYVHVDFDRFGEPARRFFDREWNPQDFTKGGVPLGPKIDQPEHYQKMVDIAETLGEEFEFIRVDLYQPNDEHVVFGELTPAPGAGRSPFSPTERDFEFGSLW